MKNIEHTDQPDEKEVTSEFKRKVLTYIGVGTGIVGATAIWVKPVVNSVVLPAHAEATTEPPEETTSMTSTEPPEETTSMTSTEPPEETTTRKPVKRIVLSPAALGIVHPIDIEEVKYLSFYYEIYLSTRPTGPVTVTRDPPYGPCVLDTRTWNVGCIHKDLGDEALESMDAETEVKFIFTAKGGGYDGIQAELTYTTGFFGLAKPEILDVTKVSESSVRITWSKPRTRAEIIGYRILELKGDRYLTLPYPVFYRPSERSSLPTGLSDITTWFIVQAEIKFRNDEVVTVNSEPSNVIETL